MELVETKQLVTDWTVNVAPCSWRWPREHSQHQMVAQSCHVTTGFFWATLRRSLAVTQSGRQDSNLRPDAPKTECPVQSHQWV
jgi:hypothetical protein